MRKVFRKITKTDYQVISENIRQEYCLNSWLDTVAIQSMVMDECNRLGIKWWGKENKEIVPILVKLITSRYNTKKGTSI